MRGYNLSDKPPLVSDYSIDKLVDDVVFLIHSHLRISLHPYYKRLVVCIGVALNFKLMANPYLKYTTVRVINTGCLIGHVIRTREISMF